jgi:AcrR family transcriptional regulator
MGQPKKTPGKRGRPRDADADRAILTATLAMFAETGAEAMSVEGIAERAGVARTTIYRRWRSKDQILLEAFRHLTANVERPIVGTIDESLPILARDFDLMMSQTVGGQLFARALNEIASGSALGRSYTQLVIEPRRNAIAEAVRAGVQRGEIRDDIDIDVTIDALIGPILLAHLLGGVGILPPSHLADQIGAVLLDGIRNPGSHNHSPDRHRDPL